VTDAGTDFGRLLTAFREARGWTKAQLAERAGLDPSSVSRFEAGTRDPEPRTAVALAEALGLAPVERERLYAGAGVRSPVWDDPLLAALAELWIDPAIPRDVADDLRTLVRVAVEHGRRGREQRRG
jgi:transcriptional regulator with XRE-family HTH domain